MSEQTDVARLGDEVQAVIKGRVLKVDDHGRVMSLKVAGESADGLYVPASAAVEVLERADDPEIGLIRSVAPSADGKPKTAVKVGSRLSQLPDQRSVWVIVETGEVLADGDVSGIGPAVGAVPGTPAAKAADKHPCIVRSDCDAELHLYTCPVAGTQAFDEMRKRIPVPLSEIFPPREFSSDGPEPPADVLVLKRLNPDDPTRWLYLLRSAGGWEWSRTAHRRVPGIHANPNSWRAAVCSNPGRFQEVTP